MMGSDESHFNVSLIVRDKVARHNDAATHSVIDNAPLAKVHVDYFIAGL